MHAADTTGSFIVLFWNKTANLMCDLKSYTCRSTKNHIKCQWLKLSVNVQCYMKIRQNEKVLFKICRDLILVVIFLQLAV